MKIRVEGGRYYVKDGRVYRKASIDEIIDRLIKEMSRDTDLTSYRVHGEGD